MFRQEELSAEAESSGDAGADQLFGIPLHCCSRCRGRFTCYCSGQIASPAQPHEFGDVFEVDYGLELADVDYANQIDFDYNAGLEDDLDTGRAIFPYGSDLDNEFQEGFNPEYPSYEEVPEAVSCNMSCSLSCSMSCSSIRDEEIQSDIGIQDVLMTDVHSECSCGGLNLCGTCSMATASAGSHRRSAQQGAWNYPWRRSQSNHTDGKARSTLGERHGLRLGLRWRYPWQQRHSMGAPEMPQEDGLKPSGVGKQTGRLRLLSRWKNMRLPRWRANRMRQAVTERPKKRQFFLALLVVIILFLSLFWRRLKLHKVVLESLVGTDRVCRRSNLSVGPWRYCGPSNFHDFSGKPIDVLDTICAQHDFCIEQAEYNVDGRPRKLYPMGAKDEDDFQRCGIPMRSHTNPNFGCQISACDREMLDSLEHGFKCADDPSMPKGPWCNDNGLVGKAHCSEHRWTWKYVACQAVGKFAKAYHGWKVRSTCNSMARQMEVLIADFDEEEVSHGRHASSRSRGSRLGAVLWKLWEFLRGDVEPQPMEEPIAWNCTCHDRRSLQLVLGRKRSR